MDGKIVNSKQSEEKCQQVPCGVLRTFLSHMKTSFRDKLRGLVDYNTSVMASTEWCPFSDNQQLNPSMGGFIADCKGLLF